MDCSRAAHSHLERGQARRLCAVALLLAGCGTPSSSPSTIDTPNRAEATRSPEGAAELPARGPEVSRSVGDVGLPASTLPTADPLWSEVEALLTQRAPEPDASSSASPSGAFERWRDERLTFIGLTGARAQGGIETDPGRRVEVRAALGLVKEQLVMTAALRPLPGLPGISDEELLARWAEAFSNELSSIDEGYALCEEDAEAPLEWRLLCRERRRSLAQLFGPGLVVDSATLGEMQRAERSRQIGPLPPGPSSCFAAPSEPATDRHVSSAVQSMMNALSGPIAGVGEPAETMVLVMGSQTASPLTEPERRALGRRLERRLRTQLDQRLIGFRAGARRTDRWRREEPCRASESPIAATRSAHPAAAVAEVHFECQTNEVCSVHLRVHPPGASGLEDPVVIAEAIQPVGDPMNPAAWRAAVDAFEAPAARSLEREEIAAAILQSAPSGPSVALGLGEHHEPLLESLAACDVAFPARVGALWRIGDRGLEIELRGAAPELPCVKAAFERAHFEPSDTTEARALLSLELLPESTLRESYIGHRVADTARVRLNGLPRSAPLEAAIAACQASHGSVDAAVGIAARIEYEASGRAKTSDVAILGAASDDYRACVVDALHATVGECDAEPVDVVVCSMPVNAERERGADSPDDGG